VTDAHHEAGAPIEEAQHLRIEAINLLKEQR
jgi:hypothetical protein